MPIIRNRYVLIADVFAVALAAWSAFALRFGWLFMGTREEFAVFLVSAVVAKISTFYALGMYKRFWRYASFWDLMAVVVANTLGSLILDLVMVGVRLADFVPSLSRSVLPMDWLVGLAFTAGIRASIRILGEASTSTSAAHAGRARRVLVAGAGDAGALVVREMQRNPQLGMVPVAFLDDEPAKRGKRIYGVPVVGGFASLRDSVVTQAIDEVVIAVPRAGGAVVRAVAESCRRAGVPSRVMPGVYELLDGRVDVSGLREVEISDLLRRPQIGGASAATYLTGATIVVTGAGGSIGSELSRQVAHLQPRSLILIGHGENSMFDIALELRDRFPSVPIRVVIADVRDRERLRLLFRETRPDVVFHAAAHKHVPLMEDNIGEAILNNVQGTRNVVDAALAAGTRRLVLVSTDKAVAPTSVMGATKRIAEMIVRGAARVNNCAFVAVRFGNVLGSRGSVVPLFKTQIARGGPVTVTHPEVERFFMTIPEAVHLIVRAGGLGAGGELFVLDMGDPVKLRDLAADMIRLSGFESHEIPIVYTGLRPGEKLAEQLWEQGANVTSTAEADIRNVNEPDTVSDDRLEGLIDRLIASAGDDDGRAIRLLSEAIPSAALTAATDLRTKAVDPKRVVRLV